MLFASTLHSRVSRARLIAIAALLALPGLVPMNASADSAHSALADTTRPATFMREIIVTGARYPRAYYQSPQALSFINSVQLREQSPIVIGDMLSMLPGVDISKDSPWEQRPVLRGLSGQRVLVLMDGTPMNSARGNGPHPSLVDPSQIERVEVVRGPASVAYGSDALGGVINIITRQPLKSSLMSRPIGGSVTMGATSAESQGSGNFTLTPHIGRLSMFLGAGRRSTGDYTTPHGTIAHSSFRDWNAIGNARYDFNDRMVLKSGYQLNRGRAIGIPGLSSPMADYGPGNTTFFDFKEYNRDQAFLALDHQYEQSWLSSSHVKVYWQKEERNFHSTESISSAYYPAWGIPPNGSAYRFTDQSRFFDLDTYGAQIQMTSKKTDKYLFTTGFDLARDVTGGDNLRQRNYHYAAAGSIDSAGTIALRKTQSLATGNFDNYAVFFQDEWTINPKWTLSAGARWTQYHYETDPFVPGGGAPDVAAKSVNNGAPSGSLGIVFAPSSDLHLSANIANGYREPNAQDLFFTGPGSVGFVLGNPDLNPEKSISYETGLRWSAPRGGAVSVSFFYSTYKDLITALELDSLSRPVWLAQTGQQHAYQYTNVATATIWGYEIEGEHRFQPNWTGRVTLSNQMADITSPAAILQVYKIHADRVPLELVPPFKGTTSVRWNDDQHRVWVESTARWAWRTNRLPPPVPGVSQLDTFKKEYIVGDIMLGMDVEPMRVQLGVKNFTNRAYRPALASVEDPGISLVGSMTVSF
jgi:hemoglobin/transferrin/lactoferrin receptor protein